MVTVKRNGKIDLYNTIKYHITPRVAASKRRSLKQVIAASKDRRRDAILLKALAK